MNAAELSPEFRRLIDARLDGIERALLQTDLTRGERQNIVAEVETQIFELLARRGDAPTLADLQAVLSSLDQPESFQRESTPEAAPAMAPTIPWTKRARVLAKRVIETGGWVLAVVVVNGVIIFTAVASDGFVPWVVFFGGLVWSNCWTIPRIRHWFATHRGNVWSDACQRLGTWLLARNGAAAG